MGKQKCFRLNGLRPFAKVVVIRRVGTGLGGASPMAAWVVAFLSPFWFITNQTSIAQKAHPSDLSLWKWVACTSEEAVEPDKWQQGQQWTNTNFLAEEIEGEGVCVGWGGRGYLAAHGGTCCSLWAEIPVTKRRERERRKARRTEGMCFLLSAPGFWPDDHLWISGTPPPQPFEDPLAGCGHIQSPKY